MFEVDHGHWPDWRYVAGSWKSARPNSGFGFARVTFKLAGVVSSSCNYIVSTSKTDCHRHFVSYTGLTSQRSNSKSKNVNCSARTPTVTGSSQRLPSMSSHGSCNFRRRWHVRPLPRSSRWSLQQDQKKRRISRRL